MISGREMARERAAELAAEMPEISRSLTLEWQDPMAMASKGLELAGLDYMRAVMNQEVPPPPIAVLMNMAPTEVEEGRAVFSALPGEEHYNPIGVVHGGFMATLLDSVAGCAVHTTLALGEAYTTLTLEVKNLRPLTLDTGIVRAEGLVTYRGRRQATADAKLYAEETGKLLASASSTCMIMS
ncbi:MAG: PaaI family thioesterase [Solirubrobacterales bacterium]|nr:PaaI family thioesterase [Solirubrobacterales bacterium]